MGGYTGDTGGRPDRRGADTLELLPSLGAQSLDTAVVESLGDKDILQSLESLGLLSLTLYIATVLDEDLGTLDDLLSPSRDTLYGSSQSGDELGELG